MTSSIKLSVIAILNFCYMLSLMATVFFYSLLGTVTTDSVEVVVSEATGYQKEEVFLSIGLDPVIVQNLFWLSLASIAFTLLVLYLFGHNFKMFISPAALSLVSFVFIRVISYVLSGFVPSNEIVGATSYVDSAISKGLLGSYFILALGIVLFVIGYRGGKIKNMLVKTKIEE